MKKSWILIVVLINASCVFGQSNPKTLDKIIALVNDQMILETDLKENIEDTSIRVNSCAKLQQLIVDNVLYSKALKDSVQVTDEEIENELNRRLDYFSSVFGSVEKMESYYKKSLNDIKLMFREELKKQMLAEKTQSKLLAGMNPTPKEVKDYFNNLPSDSVKYYNSEMQLGQIVFLPKVSRDAKKAAKEKIAKIRADIISGQSSFSTQAILYSNDLGSASNGGELGWVGHGQMVPEFENAAFSTPKGELSEIVETQYGLHLLEVEDKTKSKVKVRHILLTPKADDNGTLEAKKLADSVRGLLLANKITFQRAVELYSNDKVYKSNGGILVNMETRSPLFELKDVDPTIVDIVSQMDKGDISEPQPYVTMDRKVGYRIIKLIEETPPHKASLATDYFRIKKDVFESLKNKAMVNWLKFYKNYVYIEVDRKYDNCKNLDVFKSN